MQCLRWYCANTWTPQIKCRKKISSIFIKSLSRVGLRGQGSFSCSHSGARICVSYHPVFLTILHSFSPPSILLARERARRWACGRGREPVLKVAYDISAHIHVAKSNCKRSVKEDFLYAQEQAENGKNGIWWTASRICHIHGPDGWILCFSKIVLSLVRIIYKTISRKYKRYLYSLKSLLKRIPQLFGCPPQCL